jgi:FolB domain-containing protein
MRIHIRGLSARAIIGVRPRERIRRQRVSLDITMDVLTRAGGTDRLADAVDYVRIKDAALRHIEGSQHQLLETMASAVADLCLRHPAVQAAEVTVDKPGALTGARSVAVTLRRERPRRRVAAEEAEPA